MLTALFYANYLSYFQQWNLDKDVNFPNSSIDSLHSFQMGIFWVLVLGSTSRFFPIKKEILGFLNVALAGFFPIHEKDKKLDFLNTSLALGYTSKFFSNH